MKQRAKEKKEKKKWRLRKKLLMLALMLVLFSILVPLSVNFFVVASVSEYMVSEENAKEHKTDCIIVLCSLVEPSGSRSPMLKDRVDKGIELYQLGVSDKILMSGDHQGKEYDEVNAMRSYAIDKGVPDEAIFMDHAGLSTYESMYRAREIFQCKKVTIVTQEYHLSRAVYTAKALGLEAYGVNSDQTDLSDYRDFVNNRREFLARNKAFIECITKPKPTYLGEAIPISGSGVLTHDKYTDEKK